MGETEEETVEVGEEEQGPYQEEPQEVMGGTGETNSLDNPWMCSPETEPKPRSFSCSGNFITISTIYLL